MTTEIKKRKLETAQEKIKRRRDRDLNDLRVITASPEGRRFLWRVLSEGKIFHDGYVHGDKGYGTTYNCGRKSISVWLLSELMTAKPEAFMQMQRENASESKREEIEEKDREEQKDIFNVDN